MTPSTPERINEITRYLAYASAERVIATARGRKPAYLPKYVQDCAAQIAGETRARQAAELRRLKPKEILAGVQGRERPFAASVLGQLTFEQRNGLVELIYRRLVYKGIRPSLVHNQATFSATDRCS